MIPLLGLDSLRCLTLGFFFSSSFLKEREDKGRETSRERPNNNERTREVQENEEEGKHSGPEVSRGSTRRNTKKMTMQEASAAMDRKTNKKLETISRELFSLVTRLGERNQKR